MAYYLNKSIVFTPKAENKINDVFFMISQYDQKLAISWKDDVLYYLNDIFYSVAGGISMKYANGANAGFLTHDLFRIDFNITDGDILVINDIVAPELWKLMV